MSNYSLIPKNHDIDLIFDSKSEEEILNILKQTLQENNIRSAKDYNNTRDENLPESRYFTKKFNCRWNILLTKIGLESNYYAKNNVKSRKYLSKAWSEKDTLHLKAFYSDVSNEELAKFFDRSIKSITNKAEKECLKKSNLYMTLMNYNENELYNYLEKKRKNITNLNIRLLNIQFTNKAIHAYNELVYGNKNLNKTKDSLKNEMLYDLTTTKIVYKDNQNRAYLKSDKVIYFKVTANKKDILLYVFDVNSELKEQDVKVMNKTRENIHPDRLSIISAHLFLEKYENLLIRGNKRLIMFDDCIYYCSYEQTRNYYNYNILKYWSMDTENLEFLQDMKNYLTLSDGTWSDILEKVGISKPKIIKETYKPELPEEIIYQDVLDGVLPKFPKRFWQDDILGSHYDASAICTKYLLEKVLNWGKRDICNNLTKEIFIEYKLGGMMRIAFSGNLFYALDNAYPNRFKPFELKNYDASWYWSLHHEGLKHAYEAKEYLYEQLKEDNIIINYDNLLSYDWHTILGRYHLGGIITATYNNDLQLFFKDYFNKDYDKNVIEGYKYKFRSSIRQFMQWF